MPLGTPSGWAGRARSAGRPSVALLRSNAIVPPMPESAPVQSRSPDSPARGRRVHRQPRRGRRRRARARRRARPPAGEPRAAGRRRLEALHSERRPGVSVTRPGPVRVRARDGQCGQYFEPLSAHCTLEARARLGGTSYVSGRQGRSEPGSGARTASGRPSSRRARAASARARGRSRRSRGPGARTRRAPPQGPAISAAPPSWVDSACVIPT